MIRALALTVSLLAGMSASAYSVGNVAKTLSQAAMGQFKAAGMTFKVGDQTVYDVQMSIPIPATMSMTVEKVDANEVTISQVVDLSFQKQSCEITLNPNTGETKHMICDGKEQKPEDQGEIEIVDSKEDTVTVPAGTFTCLYVKANMKKTNENVEQWINPKLIPVFGMAKMVAPSQMGPVTIALKSFKK
jgi:hypothetical protein